MADPRRHFIDCSIGQLHLRISEADIPSSHRPLVCLHQSPKSSREFIAFMKVASADRRVIAIDSPGHGESDIPPKSEATIEGYARIIWDAIDALDMGVIDILGHHTGSKVATEMAYQRPKDVHALVMISALVLTPEERDDFLTQFQPIPLDEKGTRFQHMWAQAIRYRGPDVTLEQLAFSMAENLRAGEAYEWGHEAAFTYTDHFSERISSLPHRITILNPADMLFELTPRVGELLQNGEVIDHPEWGSGFMDIHTQAAVEAVKAALA